ncbi:post-transcriptional regulator [Bacillus ndiopicus]|uniref:post-transcriptional regulator n=1 Tax=Bacillus ndiopicus TaxID=1347368 RepID=UPI000693F267|nr:post-transcriptional regulator [Bacillus ndiopicus]
MTIRYCKLFDHVYVVLQSKIEEFRFLQYQALSEEELWNYCIDRKWRKREIESLSIAEVVATIFELTPSEVLNYHRFVSHQALDLQSELTAVLFNIENSKIELG